MNKLKRTRKKKEAKLVCLLIGILILMVIVASVLVLNNANDKKTKNTSEEDGTKEVYIEEVEEFDVSSSYGNLIFPEKWNEYISTEVIKEAESETIQFWAKVGDKEKVHVFDIIFGGEGYKVGVIKTEDNKEIDVCIESYSYELNDSWSDNEKEVLTSIDRDINYLLVKLNELDNFVPVEEH